MTVSTVRLEEISELIRNGLSVKQSDDAGGLPVTRIETISTGTINPEKVGFAGIYGGDKDGWLLQPGDILVSHINSMKHLGKCAIYEGSPDRLIHGMNLLNVRAKENAAFPRYLFHALSSPVTRRQIPQIANHSVNQSSFGVRAFGRVKIPLPPLPEQRRIAAILDKADAVRRKRQQTLDLADQFLRSAFLHLFGDPVTNPKGWPMKELGDVCDVRDGTHESPAYVSKGGYPLVTSKNLTQGFVDLAGTRNISEEDYAQINRRSKVNRGDVLMPMIGTIGSPVLVDDDPAYAIKNVALIKFDDASPSAVFVTRLFRSHYFEYAIRQTQRGGTQKFVSLGNLRSLPIPLPAIALQGQFEALISRFRGTQEAVSASGEQLRKLLGSCQQRAFRGML